MRVKLQEAIDIIKEKEILDEKGNDFPSFSIIAQHNEIRNSVLSLPTDYSYIQPYKYKTIDDICSQIAQTSINEKWLIFVKSIGEGAMLKF